MRTARLILMKLWTARLARLRSAKLAKLRTTRMIFYQAVGC